MSKIMKNIWSLPRYKREWHNICALLPAYLPDGCNGSMILYEDGGTEEIKASLSWLLDDLLDYLRSNKAVLQQQSSEIAVQMGKRNKRRLPLILNEAFLLLPVKARATFNRYHGVDGYVVLPKVANITEQNGKDGCKICFTNQVKLEVLDNMRTLKNNTILAKEINAYLREEKGSA